MRLLEKGPAEERVERGKLAVSLAAQAFRNDPADVFAWPLMRDALVAAGRVADAELVGWESIRRFPEDVQYRAQLATVLADHPGKAGEAESLLLETVDLFPAEPYARAQLATVLSDDLGRAEDARAVLKKAIGEGVTNGASRSLMMNLDQGRPLHGIRPPPAPAGEGRVLAMTDVRPDASRSWERILALRSALRQEGGSENRRTRLLLDFSASTLSSGSVASLMAA